MFYGWGANNYGQLGAGYNSEQENQPVRIPVPFLPPPVRVVGGGGHTLALGSDGGLFVCGWNRFGQLGLGHTQDVNLFTENVALKRKVSDCAGGWDFSIILLQHGGGVLAAGSNKFNQLGVLKADVLSRPSFQPIPGLSSIVCIAAGLRHGAALDQSGQLYTWGSGSKGQLGREWAGEKDSLPAPVPGIKNAVRVSCGQFFTVVTTREGEVYGFGDNKFNQIEVGTNKLIKAPVNINLRYPESVSCGWTHVVAVKQGLFYCWGRNNYHQCASKQVSNPYLLDSQEGCLLGQSLAEKVLAGSEHCLGLDVDGNVYSWGWNEHGNCGTRSTENVSAPEKIEFDQTICNIYVGSAHCFALSSL